MHSGGIHDIGFDFLDAGDHGGIVLQVINELVDESANGVTGLMIFIGINRGRPGDELTVYPVTNEFVDKAGGPDWGTVVEHSGDEFFRGERFFMHPGNKLVDQGFDLSAVNKFLQDSTQWRPPFWFGELLNE